MTDKVLRATAWPTNADMLEAARVLGYLDASWSTLDLTYGDGGWWSKWRPDVLVTADLVKPADVRCNFRGAVPFVDRSFDVVTFDPPYVCIGGRTTTGIGDMHDRFGMASTPTSPAGTQDLIDDGLAEAARCARKWVLVKCEDYVSSGHLWSGTYFTEDAARAWRAPGWRLEVFDKLHHLSTGEGGPQEKNRTRKCKPCKATGEIRSSAPGPDAAHNAGHGRVVECETCGGTGREPSRQHHAKANVSLLLVLRKVRARG